MGCEGDRGCIHNDWRGLLLWEGSCWGRHRLGCRLGGSLRLRTAIYIRAGFIAVEIEIRTCTNFISVARMRKSLRALARKLRSSKYFFRIWAKISLSEVMHEASISPSAM